MSERERGRERGRDSKSGTVKCYFSTVACWLIIYVLRQVSRCDHLKVMAALKLS